DAQARAMATCCWAADQVCELDAATVGLNDWNIAWRAHVYPDAGSEKRENIKTYRECYEEFSRRRFLNHEQYVRVIHRGIHCLTGGQAAGERRRRAEIFRGLKGKGSV